jgi:hypothetical protein
MRFISVFMIIFITNINQNHNVKGESMKDKIENIIKSWNDFKKQYGMFYIE